MRILRIAVLTACSIAPAAVFSCFADAPIAPASASVSNRSDAEDAYPLELDFGPEVDTGKYGTRRRATVTTWDTKLDWDPFSSTTLSLDVPYLVQRAPAGTIAGRSPARRVHVGSGADVSTEGVGDVSVSVDQYLLDQSDSQPVALGILGAVSFGTAPVSKGLGSGKNDYTAEAHVGHSFDRATLEFRGGYSVLGSPGRVSVDGISENVAYRNIWLASLLGAYQLNGRLSLIGALDSERASERREPPSDDVRLTGRYQVLSRIGLKAMVLRGLSRSSPTWGGSLVASIGL